MQNVEEMDNWKISNEYSCVRVCMAMSVTCRTLET